ncbi:MAG: aminotransferase class I/II-fold pyridoxal phosphate-dependent enzyme [Candidatus Thorarchaeota archaeon]|nr:aminotransferase class I/II-fold pyridoxal phosphate-dependent enzyme [Candidatus Thorarchaeota archaeon]
MDISFSAKNIAHSATLAMNELIASIRESGEKVYHMGFGESPFPVHHLIRKALCDNSWRHSYLATQGILPLREQVSMFYKKMFNLDYPPEQIVIGPGSKPLMFAALTALDGSIFLPAPSWVSYQHMGHFLSREVHHIITRSKNSYRLEPDALVGAIQENAPDSKQQKVLVMNYPCNPTGHSYDGHQLVEIADIARENNVIVLSDEIYALTHFRDQEHHSIAEFYPEGTLITGGLSKDRSLGGYRLGTLLIPPDETPLLRAILAVGSEIWSCVSAPIQYAGIEAYRIDTGLVEYIRDCATVHEVVTRYVYQRIRTMDVTCPYPQGAFYLFPDWNDRRMALKKIGITTSKELANYLLENYHVASLPGSEFGMPPEDLCLRLATVDYDGELALDTYLEDMSSALEHPETFVSAVAPSVLGACDQLDLFAAHISSEE